LHFATDNKPTYSYKYIIIDEYQDISFSRFKLIMEIRNLCGARLVCVGDDWQSIYRFAGSDILVLLTPRESSLFVEELLKDNNYLLTTADGAVNATPCPYCKTWKLVIRQNPANGSQFLGCSVCYVRVVKVAL